MPPDSPFRPILIAGIVVIMAITAYHRIRSLASGEKLDRRKEGVFMLATLRPAGAAMWGSLIAYMINPASMDWSSMPLPLWLRWTGAGVCAVTAAFLFWTLHSLGTNLTDTVVTRQQHTLVTRGPYRWIRHPFYDALALITVAVFLLAANWFMLASGIVVFVLLAVRSRVEEEQLAARFGEAYRAYQRRTGRFLPRLRL